MKSFATTQQNNFAKTKTKLFRFDAVAMTKESEADVKQPFLHVADKPIYFAEDWGTGIGGGLWSTGAALAKYFDTAHAALQLSYSRKTTSFLELGSGNGLLSVCWMAMLLKSRSDTESAYYPQRHHKVVVTDTAEHLSLIRQTLEANSHVVNDTQLLEVLVQEHLWGEFDDTNDNVTPAMEDDNASVLRIEPHQTFDFIVGSDVAYRRELYEPLIASLQHFSHDDTVILLGCTMADTTPKFFDLLRKAGFVYQKLADHVLPPEYRGQQTFGIFVVQRRIQQQRNNAW
eukprot:scaffold400_cov185-Amphora_coffeaeformis.AAC.9